MIRERYVPIAAALCMAAVCVFTAGCGSRISKSNYDKIKDGMTEAEVEGLLGKGEEQSAASLNIPGPSVGIPGVGGISFKGISASVKVVKWQAGSQEITVTFSDGKVAGREQTGL
jgi:hypothetical protein